VFKKLGRLGLLGVTKPVEYGGLGLDYYSAIIDETSQYIKLRRNPDGDRCADTLFTRGRRPSLKVRTFPDYLATQLMHKMKAAEPSSKSGGLVARMMRPPPSFSISYVRVGSFVDIRSDRSDRSATT